MTFIITNKNHNDHQNNTLNIQSSFDFIFIVLYGILVFSIIFDSCLIIDNVLDMQSLSQLAFHINGTDHDFMAFSSDAAHDYHNNLNFCIYCHFNCVLKFTDIICICSDLFLCSCQYMQSNAPKSSNAFNTHIKHIKNTRSTTNNHDNCQNKQEHCRYTLQIIVKWKSREERMHEYRYHNFSKSVPHYNQSLLMLFITFIVSKITVNFSLVWFDFCKMQLFSQHDANRDGLFGHSCVYHNIFVLCLHVFCSFCVFCVWFFLVCCAVDVCATM